MSSAPGGTCFGFELETELPLRYARRGGATGTLRIDLADQTAGEPAEHSLVFEWRPTSEHPTLDGRLFATPAGYRLWVGGAGGGWFDIEPARQRIGVPPSASEVRREERLWGIPAALAFLARGDFSLHAAAIEIDGQAVLLAAPSRFGKTTLAAGFEAHGHRLLSEDLSCLRSGHVIPGPAMLRLRHDVAHSLDIDGAEVLERDADRVHVALPIASRGDCAPVPVSAVVLLRGEAAEPALTEIEPERALADLWAVSFRLPGEEEATRCFAGLTELLESVRVFELVRPMSIAAIPDTIERLVSVG